MNRLRKWLWRVGLAAVFLAAAMLIIWVAVVPALVRRLATAQLTEAGLPVPTLEVRGLSLRCVQLANVAAGAGGRFRIGAVAAHYRLRDLVQKRLTTIEIVGLETEIRIRDGRADLGPLANLRSSGGGPTPFDRVELRSCMLRLRLDDRLLLIPFSGHVANAGGQGLKLDLSLSLEGSEARISGTVNTTTGEFALRVEGHVRRFPASAPLEGALGFVVEGERKGGVTRLSARLSADGPLRLTPLPRPISLGVFSAQAQATLDERLRPTSARLDAELGEMALEGLATPAVASAGLKLRVDDEAASVEAVAEGTGWKLERFAASLAGLAKLLREGATPAELAAKLDWKLVAPAPGQVPILARTSRPSALADLSGLGPLECSGAGTLRVRPPASDGASRWSWELEAPAVKLSLGKTTVASPRFGAAVSGLEAEATVALTAGADGATGRLLPGSRLVAQGLKAALPNAKAELKDGPEPALELSLGDKQGTFSLARNGGRLSWRLDVPAARLVVRRASAELAGKIAASGGTADIGLSLKGDPVELVVGLAPGSRLTLGSLELERAKLVAAPSKPLGSVALGGDGGKLTLSMSEGRPRWTLALSEAQAALAARRLEALGGQLRLDDPRFAARFNVDASERLLVVNRTGRWEGGAESVEMAAAGRRLSLGPLRLAIAESGEAPLLAAGFENGTLAGGRLSLRVRSTEPVALRVGEEASGAAGALAVAVEAVAEGARRSAKAELSASGIRLKLTERLADGALSFELTGAELKATASAPTEAGGLVANFDLGSAAVNASAKGLTATLPRLGLRGTLHVGARGAPRLDAEVDVADARASYPRLGLEADAISAAVPVVWHTRPGRSGLFRVGQLKLGDIKLPGPWGAAEVDDGRLVATTAWEPVKGARLTATASLGQEAGVMRGRLDFSLPLFSLEDEEALARLVPQAQGLRATGSFGAEGTLRLEGPSLHPDVAVTILDGTFRSQKWEMDAEGVFATVRLDSLTPPLTPRKELQVALVKRARMGELEVKDGFVAFRLEPKTRDGETIGWVAYLQRGEWGWAGGRIFAEKVRFDPASPRHEVTVHARDLKLGELLALIPGNRAGGVGSISGQLPVAIEGWPNIQFGNGSLRTTPGQRGWIQIRDTEPLEPAIAQVARASVPRGLSDQVKAKVEEDIRNRIINALHDFEYDELRLDFINEGGKFVARAFMKGRGRYGRRQEFGGVTLNFPGLDAFLRDAILVGRKFLGH